MLSRNQWSICVATLILIFIIAGQPRGQEPSTPQSEFSPVETPTPRRRYKMKDLKRAPYSHYDTEIELAKWERTVRWMSVLSLVYILPGSHFKFSSGETD